MINPTGSNAPGYVEQAETPKSASTPADNVVAGAVTQITNTSEQLTDHSQGESLPDGNGMAIYTAFSKSAETRQTIDEFIHQFSLADLDKITLTEVILFSDSTLMLYLGGGAKTISELNSGPEDYENYYRDIYASLIDLFPTRTNDATLAGNEAGGSKITSNYLDGYGNSDNPKLEIIMPVWVRIEKFDVTNLTSMTTLIKGITENWQQRDAKQQACIALLLTKIKALPSANMPVLEPQLQLLMNIGERLQQNLDTPAGN